MELKLPEQIDVIDLTMRDGLQNEEHYVPLEAKLYLADRLIKAGFKRLEVGSISHVAYVPQFKDVDELLLKLPKDVDVEYTVLALTPKAIERVGGLLDRGAKIDRLRSPSRFPSGIKRAVPVTAAGAVADLHCVPFSIQTYHHILLYEIMDSVYTAVQGLSICV